MITLTVKIELVDDEDLNFSIDPIEVDTKAIESITGTILADSLCKKINEIKTQLENKNMDKITEEFTKIVQSVKEDEISSEITENILNGTIND